MIEVPEGGVSESETVSSSYVEILSFEELAMCGASVACYHTFDRIKKY